MGMVQEWWREEKKSDEIKSYFKLGGGLGVDADQQRN